VTKKAKPKSKRTQVKDLQVTQQELTADKANKVKGGSSGLPTGKRQHKPVSGLTQKAEKANSSLN
jgi:hypothetical protein